VLQPLPFLTHSSSSLQTLSTLSLQPFPILLFSFQAFLWFLALLLPLFSLQLLLFLLPPTLGL
jgi:hypothetical protein